MKWAIPFYCSRKIQPKKQMKVTIKYSNLLTIRYRPVGAWMFFFTIPLNSIVEASFTTLKIIKQNLVIAKNQ